MSDPNAEAEYVEFLCFYNKEHKVIKTIVKEPKYKDLGKYPVEYTITSWCQSANKDSSQCKNCDEFRKTRTIGSK